MKMNNCYNQRMITDDLLLEINKYARKHAESSKGIYHSRNHRIEKIYYQIRSGKIAEYNLYFYLLARGNQLEQPDLEIYEDHKKSFSADLVVTSRHGEIFEQPQHIHVKSISLETKKLYGRSVVFQKSDPLVFSPKDHDWIVPMEQICDMTYKPVRFLHAPKVEFDETANFMPTKCAIYLD